MNMKKRNSEFEKQFLKFKQEKMKTMETFQKIQNMGFNGSLRTMDRHIANL